MTTPADAAHAPGWSRRHRAAARLGYGV